MNKLPIILLITFILSLLSQPVIYASSYTELEQEKTLIQKERQQVKKEILQNGETIELVNQYSKLSAKENAYVKAINYLINQADVYYLEYSVPPVDVIPGLVPETYIPIYQSAGSNYGVDWTVLAAIHSIETNFSTSRTMISSAGAIGHMQFMPSTFAAYGVDGNNDGRINPWNVEDAIFSAANYLAANNFAHDKRKAIWHYNHAEWYVNKVLATALLYSIKHN